MTKFSSEKVATDPGVKKFIGALRERPDTDYTITGMVKASPDTDGLMVAHLGGCGHWAHIPADAIEEVKQNGQIRCGNHSHSVADIRLKKPASSVELAYSAMADLHLAKLDSLSASMGGGHNCGSGHWGQDSNGNWGCVLGA